MCSEQAAGALVKTFGGGIDHSACLNMSLSEKIPSVEETGGRISHPSDSAPPVQDNFLSHDRAFSGQFALF